MTIANVLTATTTISLSLKWRVKLPITPIIKHTKLILNLNFNLPKSPKNIMIHKFFNPAIRQHTPNQLFKMVPLGVNRILSLNTTRTSRKMFHFTHKHHTIKAMKSQMYLSSDIGEVLTPTPVCLQAKRYKILRIIKL